ncbi:MAG: PAS domain S-box protein [bacterium]
MDELMRILLIEDSEEDALLLEYEIKRKRKNFVCRRVDTLQGLIAALDEESWDVVLADYNLPSFSAPSALALIRSRGLDVPFIIVSGQIEDETAVAAMKAGAHDYIMKDNLSRLVPAIEREMAEAAVRRKHRQAAEEIIRLNAELEQKVSERTAQLEGALRDLRESEKHFRKVFQEGPLGKVIVGLDNRFQKMNPAFCRILGYTKEELANLTFVEITHPDDLPVSREWLGKLYRGEVSNFNLGKRYLKKNGETVLANLFAYGIHDEEGKLLHTVSMIEDVTEKKRAEEELARIKEDFTAILTHDLRSPLSVIVCAASILMDPRLEEIPHQKMELLHNIQKNGELMLSLINNILEIAKIEAGGIRYSFDNLSLSVVFEDLHKTYRQQAKDNKVALDFSLSEDLWIKADRISLMEVFQNLVSNALNFTPEGGLIKISACREGEFVNFTVSDTGKGIPESEQGTLFQKYSSLNSTGRSSGLGLYIVKKLLEAHESDIRLTSARGEGTSFFFSLPAASPPPEPSNIPTL